MINAFLVLLQNFKNCQMLLASGGLWGFLSIAWGRVEIQGQGSYFWNVQCDILCCTFILREVMDREGILSLHLFPLIVLGFCVWRKNCLGFFWEFWENDWLSETCHWPSSVLQTTWHWKEETGLKGRILLTGVYSLRKYSLYQTFLAGRGTEVVSSGGSCSLGKKSLCLWVQILLITPTVPKCVVTALPVCKRNYRTWANCLGFMQ